MSAADFSESVRLVLAVARGLKLDTPVFRSPPRSNEVDRTIQRRSGSSVVAVRKDGRPVSAIQADIIEGVVVANYLDPHQANELRRHCWSALGGLVAGGSQGGRRPSVERSASGVEPGGAGGDGPQPGDAPDHSGHERRIVGGGDLAHGGRRAA